MKKIFLILLLLYNSFNAFSQWQFENPLPEGYSMSCVSFSDSLNGWALGGGHKRQFQNNQWTIVSANDTTSPGFLRVKMISPTDGWAITIQGKIYHYTGSNWQLNYSTINNRYLRDIDFTDANHGWAVGDSGIILHYNGSTWTPQSNPFSTNYLSVFFLNDSIGWAGSINSKMARYKNGVWSQMSPAIPSSIYNVNDIAAIDTNNIWVATVFGDAAHYDGASWTINPTPSATSLRRIFFTDAQHGWAFGGFGKILFYDGATWTVQYTDVNAQDLFADLYFTSATNGWLVGGAGIIYHWDGTIWTKLSQSANYMTVRDIIALDTTHVFACGFVGMLVDTGSGFGINLPQFYNNYYSLDYYDASHIWSASGAQTVGVWNGVSWTNQFPGLGLGQSYQDVDVVDTNHVWVVGTTGIIFFWNGSAWSQQTSSTGQSLYGVSFTDTANGWACGGNGTLLRYQSGVWSTVTGMNTTNEFYAIEFTDANHGWMMEKYNLSNPFNPNLIIHFYDGVNWIITDTIKSTGISTINLHFRDSLHGTLGCGLSSTYYAYNNGTWSSKYVTEFPGQLNCVYFLDSLNGWIGGYAGIIMHTGTGGVLTGIEQHHLMDANENSFHAFPNPSSGVTTINYTVEKRETVKIEVCNLTGSLIYTLVNNVHDAGKYSIEFDNSFLKSGIYFYRLISGEKQQTEKIIIH